VWALVLVGQSKQEQEMSSLCAQVENSTKKKSKMCGDVVQNGTCTAENPEQKPVL